MKGYVNIPKTIYVKPCVECGARPIIEAAGDDGYVVRCPNNDHYATPRGIIDLENWNNYNNRMSSGDYRMNSMSPVQQ